MPALSRFPRFYCKSVVLPLWRFGILDSLTNRLVRVFRRVVEKSPLSSPEAVQVILGSAHAPRVLPKNMADPHESWLDIVLYGVRPATAESRASAKEKHGQHMFEVLLRVGASGKGAEGRIDNVVSALRTLNSAGANIHAIPENPEAVNRPALPSCFFLRLSVSEIACIMMLPVGEDDLPGTPGLHPKLLLPPRWYKSPETTKEDRSYAKSMNASVPKKISISPNDSLEHTILLGPTGSGKSTAMEHLILSDIREGRSVLVLDPKADLVTDILERIPDGLQNPLQNQVNRDDALLPVKAALSVNKGSDLLLLGSNNLDAAGGQPQRQLDNVPQLLHEGQIIRLHPNRRHS